MSYQKNDKDLKLYMGYRNKAFILYSSIMRD